jgi:hypothetical protein
MEGNEMGLDAKDILPLIPPIFEGAKALAGLISPRAAAVVGFGQSLTEFVIDAEMKGLSPEAIVERLDELVLELKADLKFGVG